MVNTDTIINALNSSLELVSSTLRTSRNTSRDEEKDAGDNLGMIISLSIAAVGIVCTVGIVLYYQCIAKEKNENLVEEAATGRAVRPNLSFSDLSDRYVKFRESD